MKMLIQETIPPWPESMPNDATALPWPCLVAACFVTACLVWAPGCSSAPTSERASVSADDAMASGPAATPAPGEVRFQSLRRLTHQGWSSTPRFGPHGTELVFQTIRDGRECPQTYRMDADGNNPRRVSTGQGQTTDAAILAGHPRIVFSSTHAGSRTCEPGPASIYIAGPEGQNPQALAPGDDSQGDVASSPDGDRVVFTSAREGGSRLYTVRADGSELRPLTPGDAHYGEAMWSPDGARIIFTGPGEQESSRELYVVNVDGSELRQVTSNGASNRAPAWHPDNQRVIFSSDMDSASGGFDLYLIAVDGRHLERVTYHAGDDGFATFSPDGRRLAFTSNRSAGRKDGARGQRQIWVASWLEALPDGPEEALKGSARLDAHQWYAHAARLSAAEKEGRALGTAGLDRAAAYIATEFEAAGLLPGGSDASFFDAFDVMLAEGVRKEQTRFSVGDRHAAQGVEFRAAGYSGDGQIAATAVFAGEGIVVPETGRDDYEGLSLRDKVAVILQGGAAATSNLLISTDLRVRASQARARGALAVIVINDPRSPGGEALDELGHLPVMLDMPLIHVTWEGALRMFGAADASDLGAAIDGTEVALGVGIERAPVTTANVVGRLPAAKPTTRALVLGAHYDHLGMGGELSLGGVRHMLHPGANDNASGVATLIELAHALAQVEGRQVDVYFVAFSGEETGHLGSFHFVETYGLSPDDIVAMFNFDMVGDLGDGPLQLTGATTGGEIRAMIRRAQAGLGLDLDMNAEAVGSSDYLPFMERGVPVLDFFTGLSHGYHGADDTPEKLDTAGAVRVTTFAFRLIRELIQARIVVKKWTERSACHESCFAPVFMPGCAKMQGPIPPARSRVFASSYAVERHV